MFGNGLAQPAQAHPGIFQQESQRDIERRTTPHLQAVEIVQTVRNIIRDPQHVVGADASRHQRLVSIAERRIGQQQTRLVARPFGEPLRAELLQQLPCSVRRRIVIRFGNRRGQNRLGPRLIRHLRIAVDDHLAEISQQLRRAVAARRETEQAAGCRRGNSSWCCPIGNPRR